MTVFANGQLLITPTVASFVNDAGLRNKNLTVGNNVAIIGRSTKGKPKTALIFNSPSEAAALGDGDLYEAVSRAFSPSDQTPGPLKVYAMRVNPATQSSLMLLDGSAVNTINLVSTDYGLYTTQIKIKIESGTTIGKKITTQTGNDFYVQDDINRKAFSIQYTGAAATARMSITNTTLTLEAPNATVVATITLASYPTVIQLVDRINAVSGFTATVLEGNDTKPTASGLDTVTNQDVKTALYTATAHLQAIVDWINGVGEGYVTATRQANAGQMPANIGFTYLTGGSDGTVTNTDWSDSFDALQNVDVQCVCPLSELTAIHDMAEAHVVFMSFQGRMERRAFVGGLTGETQATLVANAKAMNSDRVSYWSPGFYDFNRDGVFTLYHPYMMAALAAAGFAGISPGYTLTNKAMNVRALEKQWKRPSETDALIEAGVSLVREERTGFKVVKAIAAWLVNDNFNRVEISTGFAVDFVARNVREALEEMIGEPGDPTSLVSAFSRIETALIELSRLDSFGHAVIVGDANNPAFKNIKVSLEGDVIRAEFQCSPVIPINYVLVTIYAQAYSGTLTSIAA